MLKRTHNYFQVDQIKFDRVIANLAFCAQIIFCMPAQTRLETFAKFVLLL